MFCAACSVGARAEAVQRSRDRRKLQRATYASTHVWVTSMTWIQEWTAASPEAARAFARATSDAGDDRSNTSIGIAAFTRWCAGNQIEPEAITREIVRRYVEWLSSAYKNPRTRKTYAMKFVRALEDERGE